MRDIDTEEQARVTDDPSGIGKRLVLNLPISGKDTRLPVVAARPPAPVLQAATTVRSPKKRGSAGAADAALADMAVGQPDRNGLTASDLDLARRLGGSGAFQ